MAVIGAKGNFAGPGASFDGEDEKKHEIVCTQVNYNFYAKPYVQLSNIF